MAVLKTSLHGGNLRKLAEAAGLSPAHILDFSANINPLGPPEWLRPLIISRVASLVHYPDPDCAELLQAAAARYGVKTEETIAGNGSTEILHLLPRVLTARRAVVSVPAYVDYAHAAELAGLPVERVPLAEERDFRPDPEKIDRFLRDGDLFFTGQPNNPTGLLWDAADLRRLARRHPAATIVIDEAFADFVPGMDSLTQRRPPNVVVLLSLTKFFAVPGIRLGCAVADPALIARIKAVMPPWTVNTLAQAIGAAALADAAYAEKTRAYVGEARETLVRDLTSLGGFYVYPGEANFLLVKITRRDLDAPELAGKLLRRGIGIRVCDNFAGLDRRFFRIAVRTGDENRRLCQAIGDVLKQRETLLRNG
ncbi:MAG: threonine-phosphate decarboxylase [Syntrophobacterales bacterium]|nr:threonine-phosphate decarboxylase [Syntrophobacterales bacterium]